MIRSFIFDIGNVILPVHFERALQRIQPLCPAPLSTTAYQPLLDSYESGQIGRARFLEQITTLMGYQGAEADFVSAWQEIFDENTAITRLIQRLQPRYPLYLLSNTSDLHVDYFTAQYPIFSSFSNAVYSHLVGCSKPGQPIYEIAARQFGVEPRETVFIDDLPANIAAARQLGFQALQYDHRQHHRLLEQLAALGVEGIAE